MAWYKIVANTKDGSLKKEVKKPINQFLLQYFQNLSNKLNNFRQAKEDFAIRYSGIFQNILEIFIINSIKPTIAEIAKIISKLGFEGIKFI